MKEAIQAGHEEGKSMRNAATTFIQSYRASPHTTTKISPFAAMRRGREIQTKLPMDTYCDDVVDREQVVNTKSKKVARDTVPKSIVQKAEIGSL